MHRDALAPAPHRLSVDRSTSKVVITARSYSLSIKTDARSLQGAPVAVLSDPDGVVWSRLSLLASANTRTAADESLRVDDIAIVEHPDRVEVRVRAASSHWSRRDVVVECREDSIELRIELEGTGSLTTVTFLGGRGAMPSSATGEFRSSAPFFGVFVPTPTEPVAFLRPAAVPAALGVIGDADAGRLNAVFSPPPLALSFSRRAPTSATGLPDTDWLGLWLRAPVDELTMTAMRYAPLDGGFLIALDYEGHTLVDGSWTSPTAVIRPTTSGMSTLLEYERDLATHGFAPGRAVAEPPAWWTEPIFCGWGAQCARVATAGHDAASAVRGAPDLARADVYDEFLERLTAHDLDPGTIVIDDRWQREYGTAEVDLEHWPDLRGWIAARHAEGRRVLLWWKAWDPEGIPAEECVRRANGEPVTVDPGNSAYRERLATIIRYLLSPDGLDADGLKIDFTQRGPSGESLVGTDGVWGIAALHRLLGTIAEAARAVRPDPLLIAHAVHPSFADVYDMVRLNDVLEFDLDHVRVPVVDQLAMRHGIASRVLPGMPIDTDQWPMPNRAEWLSYAEVQPSLGVPALYYLESIDESKERIESADLLAIAETWAAYRKARR